MPGAQPDWALRLLQVWFGDLKPADWFGANEAIDRLLRENFEATLLELAHSPATDFLDEATTTQAAILLFDQIPRNLYRGTAQAFAFDPLALELAKTFIAAGHDANLPDHQRQFVAMPLMHSEDLTDQEASLAYFAANLPGNLTFAKNHHEMIARFGRFPHRNAALGRSTSKAERRAIDDGFSW